MITSCNGLSDTALCQELFETGMFFKTDKTSYGWQGVVLSGVCGIICCGLYVWLRKREAHLIAGNADKANEMFLHVYGKVIRVYLLLVLLTGVVYGIFAVCLALKSLDLPVSFLSALLSTLPSTQMILILSLFTKNTISDRAFWRAVIHAGIYAGICYPGHIIGYICYSTKLSGVLHLGLDIVIVLFTIFLWCRQWGYFWARKSIIMKYSFMVVIIEAFQTVNGKYFIKHLTPFFFFVKWEGGDRKRVLFFFFFFLKKKN
ncbi:hypothetical protein RFI_36149 [Reticulomyxa filosa]|uniref:Uncharacterized protein n=1 Tax=Reticulomyxa filosa TaxID=46433 RepID=X6LIV3_RETFI|nr:hypothetical protein RFI_36149 [Reticulomyxa filosa]|eukprot:ETO01291.1 hypothetical protein RFI_36149 [Reticulomyxa filosa]